MPAIISKIKIEGGVQFSIATIAGGSFGISKEGFPDDIGLLFRVHNDADLVEQRVHLGLGDIEDVFLAVKGANADF